MVGQVCGLSREAEQSACRTFHCADTRLALRLTYKREMQLARCKCKPPESVSVPGIASVFGSDSRFADGGCTRTDVSRFWLIYRQPIG